MRRALGLRDDAAPRGDGPAASRPSSDPRLGGAGPVIQRREADRRTRRFVKDGEVPVVVLNGSRDHSADGPAPVNRLAATESALAGERAARERAERALHEAQATIQHLKTQVAHANIAHGEAFAAERQARQAAEEACAAALVARDALEATVSALEAKLDALEAAPPPPAFLAVEPAVPAVRRPRRRPETEAPVAAETDEPEPVKWWLPSYKTKAARR